MQSLIMINMQEDWQVQTSSSDIAFGLQTNVEKFIVNLQALKEYCP